MTVLSDLPITNQNNHWTTSNGCVFHPTDSPNCSSFITASQSFTFTSVNAQPTIPPDGTLPSSVILPSDSLPTSFPSDSASTSFNSDSASPSFPLNSGFSSTLASSSSGNPGLTTNTPTPVPVAQNAVCAGEGFDASADGILASLIIPSVLGLLAWLLFAILRPHFRQIYALREWFPPQDTRPKPLSTSFWAFLFPHVPLIPAVSDDVADAGSSAEQDAKLFPSDEELTQRTLFIALRIVFVWSILGLAGALPLYLVGLPCEADSLNQVIYGGASSMMQDFSLHRLLKLFDSGSASSNNLIAIPRSLFARALDDDDSHDARVRIIILTVLAVVAVLFPALFTIVRELNRLVAYRKAWIEIKCCNLEMGWLSISDAPGFKGWGEKELKDHLIHIGVAATMKGGRANKDPDSFSRSRIRRRKSEPSDEQQPLSPTHPEETAVVNIHSLYTTGNTGRLSGLIDERDEILENLEVAETHYISSFRIKTPAPSIADPLDSGTAGNGHTYIGRPQRLRGFSSHQGRISNPALASSSRAPTTFVGPAQLYRLLPIRGVTGGFFTGSQPSFSGSSHPMGSRLQDDDSRALHPISPGSETRTDEHALASSPDLLIPDPRRFGPNAIPEENENGEEPDWVDISELAEQGPIGTSENGAPSRQPALRPHPLSSSQANQFHEGGGENYSDNVPPHLRGSQTFVRPVEGVKIKHLASVYGDITHWRSRLKAINQEIAEAQSEGYTNIAEGTQVKGWMLIGVGLRFLPNIQLIEGRAKEDVRWDVLQNQRTLFDAIAFLAMCLLVVILLAAGLTAAAGLALANAPEVAHYVPFLQPLWDTDPIVTGIATIFAPSVAATLFIAIALYVLSWAANSHSVISVSGSQMLLFRSTFWILTAISAIWLIAVGAVIFTLHPFSTGEDYRDQAREVANGSIYMAIIALALVLNVAILFPGLLLLQPMRLWHVRRTEKHAVTPRQRFRAVYPRSYNPSYAIAPCILAIVFAATFSLIFPLIGPAVTILLLLTLLAHRFLVGYVYGRTHSQTGGQLSIYIIRRLGTLVAFQPILLGLIFLSRNFSIQGGVLVGLGLAVIIFMEIYAYLKTRLPGFSSLTTESQDAVRAFRESVRHPHKSSNESNSSDDAQPLRNRGSMASVLEMMSITLAVMPSHFPNKGPLPLPTETIDDLTATERAARTNPAAPPRLPPLPWTKEDFSGLLYTPELLAGDPKIWLPNDSAGVARSEALDLQRYHQLEVILDVQNTERTSRPSNSSR